tara:strand:+ start:147 stop:902 length:756 start_codon:yes stop_codon:yes gene_type:complete
MKNIYSITAVLFLALLSVSFVSAMQSPITCATEYSPSSYYSTIINLPINSQMELRNLIGVCMENSCVINEDARTVTIRSHYNSDVALIFFYNQNGNTVHMTTKIPHKLQDGNSSIVIDVANLEQPVSEENASVVKCAIQENIDPSDYNWAESVNTDLSYLKNLGLLAISDGEITQISSNINGPVDIGKSEGEWAQVYSGGVDSSNTNPPEFPTLPSEEFSIAQTSSNLIYWIIGIALVLVIVLFFIFRKKK